VNNITQFGNEASDFENTNEGVPQGSKLGPIAFVIQINMPHVAIKEAIMLLSR
jgi:hypothetical protein